LSKNILNEIIEILKSDPFNLDDKISQNSEIKMFANWDSLKHLMFMLELEKKFEVEITPEEVTSILTVNNIIKKINEK
jgi:acyl carrier protein